MLEANHRAAVQIFERVNSSLLPKNILDLHGLHVHEALAHLTTVLQDKTKGDEQYVIYDIYYLNRLRLELLFMYLQVTGWFCLALWVFGGYAEQCCAYVAALLLTVV